MTYDSVLHIDESCTYVQKYKVHLINQQINDSGTMHGDLEDAGIKMFNSVPFRWSPVNGVWSGRVHEAEVATMQGSVLRLGKEREGFSCRKAFVSQFEVRDRL